MARDRLRWSMRCFLFFGIFIRTNAQAPDVPHGGGSCATEWDCSLGGSCTSNACVCDAWWTGSTCAQLNLQPADPEACGLVAPGYFSWGGHPLRDSDGTYHLLASFLCNHETLSTWKTKSSIAHATSRSPTGPFVIPEGLDQQLALPPWSVSFFATRTSKNPTLTRTCTVTLPLPAARRVRSAGPANWGIFAVASGQRHCAQGLMVSLLQLQ